MRVTMQNFVKIGQTVEEILRFYRFPKWRSPPSWIFKNSNFYWLIRLADPICVSLPNFIKIGQSVAEIWRIFDFSRWHPSAILNLLLGCLDCARTVLSGLYHWTKIAEIDALVSKICRFYDFVR